jgi:hypothetical protein
MNTCSRYLELVATDAAHAYAFFQCTLPKKLCSNPILFSLVSWKILMAFTPGYGSWYDHFAANYAQEKAKTMSEQRFHLECVKRGVIRPNEYKISVSIGASVTL